MGKKYKFMEVGTTRHPEIYDSPEVITEPVVTDVDVELRMWEAAEAIVSLLEKGDFTIPQGFFIWHYVNALKGMDNLDEIKWFEFMKFRLYYARMRDMESK